MRALRPPSAVLDDEAFSFRAGEPLHTENSHKYSPERLNALIAAPPWRREKRWSDERQWFAACLLGNS
jgi:uncharacterized SAM-dependent methyltransferase